MLGHGVAQRQDCARHQEREQPHQPEAHRGPVARGENRRGDERHQADEGQPSAEARQRQTAGQAVIQGLTTR